LRDNKGNYIMLLNIINFLQANEILFVSLFNIVMIILSLLCIYFKFNQRAINILYLTLLFDLIVILID